MIGTERHDSRRVDTQLRVRAAPERSRTPASSCARRQLLQFRWRPGGWSINAFRVEEGMPIESGMLTRSLKSQKKVGAYYDIRKQVFEYDEVMNSSAELGRVLDDRALKKQVIGYGRHRDGRDRGGLCESDLPRRNGSRPVEQGKVKNSTCWKTSPTRWTLVWTGQGVPPGATARPQEGQIEQQRLNDARARALLHPCRSASGGSISGRTPCASRWSAAATRRIP